MTHILLVEDEEAQRELLADLLATHGHEITEAGTRDAACEALDASLPDLLLSDFNLPDGDGLEVLEHARSLEPDLPAVILSAYGTVAMAVDAMKSGAFDVLLKPIEPERLLESIAQALDDAPEREPARSTSAAFDDPDGILGTSQAIQEARVLARRLARTDAPVLITGESGTGKELFARMLHTHGPQPEESFVAVNCGAVPAGLIESEFFGHAKGAFTGATADRAGCFEEAGRGTLFLDEIGELPLVLQGRLLRVLQQQEIVRVGEALARPVHARIVTATNRDLEADVRAGTFRADLFHRIHVLRLHLPPLRERGGDVLQLAKHFLEDAATRLGRVPPRLTYDVQQLLTQHAYPGNVRELRNLMEQTAVMAMDGVVELRDLPPEVLALRGGRSRTTTGDATYTLDLRAAVAEVEERLIRAALQRTGGVQTKAAKLLGIDERVLRYRRAKLGIAKDGGE